MDISTKCNSCVKQDVCKYQDEYEATKQAIMSATYAVGDNGICTVKDSPIVKLSINCAKFNAGKVMR